MFLSRNNRNNVYPCKPQFYYIKVGFKGVKIILACFRDAHQWINGYFSFLLTNLGPVVHSIFSLPSSLITNTLTIVAKVYSNTMIFLLQKM